MLSIKEINLLQAQNEGLKKQNADLQREKAKYYQQTLDDEIQINELLQTLQEIKVIAEKEIYMKQNSSMDRILNLITKAESEEK